MLTLVVWPVEQIRRTGLRIHPTITIRHSKNTRQQATPLTAGIANVLISNQSFDSFVKFWWEVFESWQVIDWSVIYGPSMCARKRLRSLFNEKKDSRYNIVEIHPYLTRLLDKSFRWDPGSLDKVARSALNFMQIRDRFYPIEDPRFVILSTYIEKSTWKL